MRFVNNPGFFEVYFSKNPDFWRSGSPPTTRFVFCFLVRRSLPQDGRETEKQNPLLFFLVHFSQTMDASDLDMETDHEEGLYLLDDMDEEDRKEISQDESWSVIRSYFKEKGLVRQQLNSFDEFIEKTIQGLIDKRQNIILTPETYEDELNAKKFEIAFHQAFLAKARWVEQNQQNTPIHPHQARLRGLTYAAPVFVDIETNEHQYDVMEDAWIQVHASHPEGYAKLPLNHQHRPQPKKIGKIPVMLQSKTCYLSEKSGHQLTELGECPYDEGGYFILNGGERVLVAQEKMSLNQVFVFKKYPPTKYSYVSEIRSVNQSGQSTSTFFVKKTARSSSTIEVVVPMVRKEIPVIILFRALGFESDKQILSHICYDFEDDQMMQLLRPSLMEAISYNTKELALDFIGKRATNPGTTRKGRIDYARDILQKNLLPHVSVEEGCEIRKAFFVGYMVHRLLSCFLGRRQTDDRDHYGNKRLDLAGPLLSSLFRRLFGILHDDIRKRLQKNMDKGNAQTPNVKEAVREKTITDGLQYSLATGNWDTRRGQAAKTGVSQVLSRLTFTATLSHLRRLNTPIDRTTKQAKPRQLHNTHWGMILLFSFSFFFSFSFSFSFSLFLVFSFFSFLFILSYHLIKV